MPMPPNTPPTASGRAWATLRFDVRREVDKKKIHRLWREQGLQVKVTSPRRRAGVSSIRPIIADASNVVWAIDVQFEPTTKGRGSYAVPGDVGGHTKLPSISTRMDSAAKPATMTTVFTG